MKIILAKGLTTSSNSLEFKARQGNWFSVHHAERPKETQMTKIYKAYVYEEPCGRFMGEIDGIYINTNIGEIKNTPIEFYADSKQALLDEMVKFLKGIGLTGILRVVN